MTQFVAYDDLSIYAVGKTPEEAIAQARVDGKDPHAQFRVAKIRDGLAASIERDGWDGMVRAFDIDDDGFVVECAA